MPISFRRKPCCAVVNSLPKPSDAAKPSWNRRNTTSGRSARQAGEPCGSFGEHRLHQNLRSRVTAPSANGKFGRDNSCSPGTQVISFVALTKWVQANYRETQLTNVKIGDPAELRIDEYPDQRIRGKVVEIAPASGSQFALLPPDNATGQLHESRAANSRQDRAGGFDARDQTAPRNFGGCDCSHQTSDRNLWQLRPSQFARPR